MNTERTAVQVALLIAVALAWLLVNLKAGKTSIKRISFYGILLFLGTASWLTLAFIGLLPWIDSGNQ